MGYVQSLDDYFTYESRLASFRNAHAISKRRASSTSIKGPKSLKWPHKFPSTSDLAKAGFYYYPSQVSPDNVICFLCHKSLDGWEETDDPLVEHLRHSPNCGWAITVTTERLNGELSEENLHGTRILEARKATFSDKWPHENKKGWKCHVKQMIEAGWRYTPTLESDDMVTCNYCALALNNWGKSDKPSDKHYEHSPDCPFFTSKNNHRKSPQAKKFNPKRTRATYTSRCSVKSNSTVCSNGSREASLPTEDEESVLTTASTSGQKMAQEKKKALDVGRRTRTKRNEAVEVTEQEVTTEKDQELNRGKKRISDESQLSGERKNGLPPKRRTARNRGSVAVDHITPQTIVSSQSIIKAQSKKTRSTLNDSLMKVSTHVNDLEIERALEADLDRQISDDEALDLGLNVAEENVKPFPRLRSTRSTSAGKQEILCKEVDETESQRLENKSLDRKIAVDIEDSISTNYSSPQAAPLKKRQAAIRQATRKLPTRNTRGSTISLQNHDSSMIVSVSTVETTIEPRKSMNGITVDHSATLKSISLLTNLHDEGEAKCGSDEISIQISKESCQPTENPDSNVLTIDSCSPYKENKQARNLEHDITEKESDVHNLMISRDKPDKKKAAKQVHSKKYDSGKLSKENSLPKSTRSQETAEATSNSSSPKFDGSTSHTSKPPMVRSKTSTPRRKDATPSHSSPQCSDAENEPPYPKPTISATNLTTPPAKRRVVIIDGTPVRSSPSKRSLFAGLQSDQPWTAVDPYLIFCKSPTSVSSSPELATNTIMTNNTSNLSPTRQTLEKVIQQGGLTSLEEKMTLEEWIHHNAHMAEENLKMECERMVSKFERQGTRAIRTLEGIRCME